MASRSTEASPTTEAAKAESSSRESEEKEEKYDQEEEEYHFQRVIGSFVGYEGVAMAEAERTRRAASRLRPEGHAMLPEGALERRVKALEEGARRNSAFLNEVVRNQGGFGPLNAAALVNQRHLHPRARPRRADHGKVRSTLQSVVREWTTEGEIERRQAYEPLLDELERSFPLEKEKRAAVRVLIPGAGLGRLPLEVAARGYSAQGNEFSYHMLLVSNYLLNAPELAANALTIQPFIDQPSNVRNAEDRCRKITFPDVSPAMVLAPLLDAPGDVDFSMAAGEFLEVYADQANNWDAIVTCFFVDTAPVVLDYINAIWRLLKPNGKWLNLGPLLYHWATPSSSADVEDFVDDRYNQSVELSWDELRFAILRRGFSLQRETFKTCNYTHNPKSLQRITFDSIFFTAVKPGPVSATSSSSSS